MSNKKTIKIELKPNTDKYRRVPLERCARKYSGNIIQQRKGCLSCPCFQSAEVIPNVQQIIFSHIEAVSEDRNKVLGICARSVYWKVLYKTEKPKKCSKIKKQNAESKLGFFISARAASAGGAHSTRFARSAQAQKSPNLS